MYKAEKPNINIWEILRKDVLNVQDKKVYQIILFQKDNCALTSIKKYST